MLTEVIYKSFLFFQIVFVTGDAQAAFGQAEPQESSIVEIMALLASLSALVGLYFHWRSARQKDRELELQQSNLRMALAEFEERFTSQQHRIGRWAESFDFENLDNLGVGGPYIVGPAIISPENFFGRQVTVERFYSGVVGMQLSSVSLTGVRRSGKTSFLNYISHPTVLQTFLGSQYSQIVPVYLNMQANITSRRNFYEYLATRSMHIVQRGWKGQQPPPAVPDQVEYQFLEGFFDELCGRGLRFILLLDEIEMLEADAGFDEGFFGTLRALATVREIAWVTTSYSDVYQLDKNLRTDQTIQLTSPFYNIFRPQFLHLGALTLAEARQLIEEPAARVNHTYSGADVEFVINLAGRLPYFIQCCASMLFNAQNRGELDDSSYSNVRELFAETARRHFQHYWARFTTEERRSLSNVAKGRDVSSQDQHAAQNLQRHGFIEGDGEKYEFLGTAFADWIREVEA